MAHASLNIWIMRVVQVLYALILGACFLVGEAMSNWGVFLFALALGLLLRMDISKLSKHDFALIMVLWGFFFYFGWRELVSPFSYPEKKFFYENLVFLYAPIILVAFRSIDVDRVFSLMAYWLVPSALLTFLIAWYQVEFLEVGRADGFANNPLSLAMFITIGVHLSLANFRDLPRWVWPLLALVWLAGWYVILDFTESRLMSLLYPLFGGLFVVYVFCSVHYSSRKNLARISIIALISISVLFILLTLAIHFGVSSRLNSLVLFFETGEFSQDRSAGYRAEMYSLAWAHLGEVPFFGIGPENTFELIIQDWPYDRRFYHLHNDALNLFVAGGWIGLGFYVLLTFWPLSFLLHQDARQDRFYYVAFMILTFVVLQGLTSRIYFSQPRVTWYLLALVFLQIYSNRLRHER